MNKTTAWIIAALVIIVGVVLWATAGDEAEAPTNGEEEVAEQQKDTLRALLASNTSQECTFSDAETDTEGTLYVADGNMRGDFTTQQDGSTVSAHTIVVDETVYTWIEGQEQGFQISLEQATEGEATAGSQVDFDRPVNYECNATAVSDSRFDLPDNVTFTSVGSFDF